jgi:hypothetical protein
MFSLFHLWNQIEAARKAELGVSAVPLAVIILIFALRLLQGS